MEVTNISKPASVDKVVTETKVRASAPSSDASAIETLYSYDKEANMFIVKFTDPTATPDARVVKQYPPEEMVELAKKMNKIVGNVINTTA